MRNLPSPPFLLRSILITAILGGISGLTRQDPKADSRPADRPPAEVAGESAGDAFVKLDKLMASQGVLIDRARKLVSVRGRFCSPKQPLEYLITAPHGSHYESLVAIDARPSNLATALISLGVNDEGNRMPARKPKSPKPTEAELAAGALLYEVEPAKGQTVHIYVEWNDERGFQRHRLESLVFERPEGRTIPNLGFVFVNSSMLVPRNKKEAPAYAANLDGNLVACGVGGQPVLVYVKPHPYAMEGDFEIYQPNWTLVPSDTLPVVLVFSKEPLDTPLMRDMTPPESLPASRPEGK